jgi:hypothetical protein
MVTVLSRAALSSALMFVVSLPVIGLAAVGDSVIDEVMAGFGGDQSVQYVEIRMQSAGQGNIGDGYLGFFNCSQPTPTFIGIQIPTGTNLPNAGAGTRWLAATADFAALPTGVTPDVILPSHPGILEGGRATCGMVCWGKPTGAPNQASQYDDCVAYGGYSFQSGVAANPSFAGMPTSLMPNDGSMSLTRMSYTPDNATDFALRPPSPTNNAGQVGLGGSTTTTTTPGGGTTTTLPAGATTTTTLPGGAPARNLVRGGGPVKSDCYVELDVQGATDIKGNKTVTCTDGDPCDADGTSGTCTFKVALCPNQVFSGCTTHPPVTLSGKSVAPSGPLTPPTDLSGSDCGPFADVKVSLKKNGKKAGKTVLHVKAKVIGGKPKTDVDNVKLICKPRPGT